MKIRFLIAFLIIATLIGCLSAPSIPTPEPYGQRYIKRGAELVKGLAACGYCHGDSAQPDSPLSGGRSFEDKYGEVLAANITPSQTGVGDWTAEELSRAIRFSIGRDEEPLSIEAHEGYRWMSDQDVYSIIAYLRTVKPVDHEVERRSLSIVDRYTVGLLESHLTVAGYVPSLDSRNVREYGKYLVNNLARCATCHNSPESLLEEEQFLDGGKEIKLSSGENRVAPNITGSKTFGIGSWTQSEIVSYLKTGQAPGNKISDQRFCPTHFYKNAFGQDLFAIAKYLKSVESADAAADADE